VKAKKKGECAARPDKPTPYHERLAYEHFSTA
jgi:hypothetical protein